MRSGYLEFTPGMVRFKVMRLLEDLDCPEVRDEELENFNFLRDSFARADEELEKVLRKFPRRFYRYFNKPAHFSLSEEKAKKLVEFLERKCGCDISEETARLRYRGKVYLVAFDFQCG